MRRQAPAIDLHLPIGLIGLIGLLVLIGCGDDAPPPADGGAIDFGPVFVGDEKTVDLPVAAGKSRLEVRFVDGPAGFRVEPRRVSVAAGKDGAFRVIFAPRSAGPVAGSLKFDLGDDHTLVVRVTGVGIPLELAASPPELDFDGVITGSAVFLDVEVTNLGALDIELPVSLAGRDAASFGLGLAEPQVAIASGDAVMVPVGFFPTAAGAFEAELVLGACATCAGLKVSLRASGVELSLEVDPPVLEFPPAASGSRTIRTVTLRNASEAPVLLDLATVVPAEAPFTVEPERDAGAPAGGELVLNVEFAPLTEGDYTATLRLDISGTRFEVPLSASSVPALAAEPPAAAFGRLPVGSPFERTVRLVNEGGAPVVVTGLRIEPEDAGFTARAQGALPLPVASAADVVVTFLGGDAGLAAADLFVDTAVGAPLRVHLSADAVPHGPCALAAPSALRFGLGHIGEVYSREVRIENIEAESCFVWDARVEPGGSAGFLVSLPGGVVEIPPATVLELPVQFTPPDDRVRTATILFSLSAASSARTIEVSGQGAPLLFRVDPPDLSLGDVVIFHNAVRGLALVNEGSVPLRIEDVQVSGGTPSTFAVYSPRSLPGSVPGGGTLSLFGRYRPVKPGVELGSLEIYLRGFEEPVIVPLDGKGISQACDPACRAPVVACPAGITGQVHLRTDVFGGAFATAGPTGCTFEVISSPEGSTVLPPDSFGLCRVGARFDTPGDYRVRLTASGPDGSTSCEVPVLIEPADGLWVETVWSAPTDLDLHLLHPDAGDPLLPASWTGTGLDAWAGNPRPSWGAAGTADDPELLLDEDNATGPELLRLGEPEPGKSYAVGAHWNTDFFPGVPLLVTTKVVCDSELLVSDEQELDDAQQGVVVGTVTKGDASCVFQAIGTKIDLGP